MTTKQIKPIFRKIICFSLSIFMLTANTFMFAQDFHGTINSITTLSAEEIQEIENLVNNIERYYYKSLSNIESTAYTIIKERKGEYFIKATNPYSSESTIYNSFQAYYEDVYKLEDAVNNFQKRINEIYGKYLEKFPERSYLRKATENYLKQRLTPLFESQTQAVNKMLSWADLIKEQPKIHDLYSLNKSSLFINENAKFRFYKQMYDKESSFRNYLLEDLAGYQKKTEVIFTWNTENIFKQIKRVDSSFSPEAISFFSKNYHTLDEITAYFAKRTPEIQRSTVYALKITNEGVTVNQLLNYTQEYLKKTNKRLLKVKNLTPEVLKPMLSKMSVANRTHFVESLVDFEPEAKVLANEFRKAEMATGKRLLPRTLSKLSTPLLVVGSFFLIMDIVDVQAQSSFKETSFDVVNIQTKINNGEFLSYDEFAFYMTDESARSEIIKNPDILPEVLEATIAINKWLDPIEEAINNSEEIKERQQENTYNAFEQYYQDSLEQVNLQFTEPNKK